VWREHWLNDPPATIKADCFNKVLIPARKGKIKVDFLFQKTPFPNGRSFIIKLKNMQNLEQYFCKCRKCGEYNGAIKKKELYPKGSFNEEEAEEYITVSCLCNGILCSRCKKNKINRPISNSYCPGSNTIEHWPWFTGWMLCRECMKKDEKGKLNNK
jgi:hypothetical protein